MVRDPGKNDLYYYDFIKVCSIVAKFPEISPDRLDGMITFPLADIEKVVRWRNYIMKYSIFILRKVKKEGTTILNLKKFTRHKQHA